MYRTLIIENPDGVATTPPPFGGRVTENGSGVRGIREVNIKHANVNQYSQNKIHICFVEVLASQ